MFTKPEPDRARSGGFVSTGTERVVASMASKLLPFLLAILLAACAGEATGPPPPPPPPELPVPLAQGDGWPVASLASAEIDAGPITTLIDLIERDQVGHLHSLLIARNGQLVYEGYFHGYDSTVPHPVQSVTKSIASALIGIAVDQGLLQLDQTLDLLLPARAPAFVADPAKRSIRLQDLLTMEAGLAWDEWTCDYTEPCNDNNQMNASLDWVGYVLSKPVIEPPGQHFVYNSGASNILAEVLLEAAGEDPVAFARRELFEPLGIDTLRWFRNTEREDSLPHFGGGLGLRGRDLLKFGQLYLDRGVWQGNRVLSADWVDRTGSVHATIGGDDRYGFQWWLRPILGREGHAPAPSDMVYGWGYGGQHVFVVRSLGLVVVVMGWNPDGSTRGHDIMDDWIVPAVR